jgi:ubiquinol-cytochrome c reductase iron-sulfur subunit
VATDESTDLVPAETVRERPGTAVARADAFENPGIPPHRPRMTDVDPRAARRAERSIVTLFFLSVVGTVFTMAAYFAFPIQPNDLSSVRLNNLMLGIGLALALLTIGIGAVHWG